MCSSDDESGDGQSTTTHNDVNSDVSFEEDADEEIDTTSIEEEWIEYIKRSTEEAIEKMESAKIRWWNKTHKKWNGNWHSKTPLHQATDGWERLLTGTLNWAQDTGPTERSGDQEKDGKTTLTNSSNKNLKILKIQLKATTKPTKHGST